MSRSKSSVPESLGNPWVASACLTLVMLAVFPAFGYFGYWAHGTSGVWAASVAGLLCWLGALLALLVTSVSRGAAAAIHGILLGTVFRMGLPLVAGIVLMQLGGPLAEGGVLGLIVGYYLVGLVVETLLSLCLVAANGGATRAS